MFVKYNDFVWPDSCFRRAPDALDFAQKEFPVQPTHNVARFIAGLSAAAMWLGVALLVLWLVMAGASLLGWAAPLPYSLAASGGSLILLGLIIGMLLRART